MLVKYCFSLITLLTAALVTIVSFEKKRELSANQLFEIIREYSPLLMPYDEYKKLEKIPTQPSFLKIEKGDQKLMFCGFRHSGNPNHSSFEKLENEFKDFIKDQEKTQNSIIYVEGGIAPFCDKKYKAISNFGENGLMVHLAQIYSIPLKSPESNRCFLKALNDVLLKKFTKDEIFYTHVLQTITQWHRFRDQFPNLKNYLERFFIKESNITAWEDFSFTWEYFLQIHEQFFHIPFDQDDEQFVKSLSNPLYDGFFTNKITRESSIARDCIIISNILKHWNKGLSLVIVFGQTHMIMQEPALRALLVP